MDKKTADVGFEHVWVLLQVCIQLYIQKVIFNFEFKKLLNMCGLWSARVLYTILACDPVLRHLISLLCLNWQWMHVMLGWGVTVLQTLEV